MLTNVLLGVCVFMLVANLGVQVARMVNPTPKLIKPKEAPLQVTSWRVIQSVGTPEALVLTYRVVLSDHTTWEGSRNAAHNWWHGTTSGNPPGAYHAKVLEEFLNERENTLYVNATRAV